MNTREQIREILVELIPKPYKDYNQGLLPDEDGYDTDKLERIYNWEEEIDEATKQIQDLIDDARIDELESVTGFSKVLGEVYTKAGVDTTDPKGWEPISTKNRIKQLQERKNNG